jgi:crotonobetainyl-CoA:carnitine CoA-transferase CaiB-like acyl-CoA transferase
MAGSGLLDGVRVIEFGQIAAGPYAGSLLADLGADVVKVERPGTGDGMRSWPPLTENDDHEAFSENFASLNRNKRSVALDVKDEADVSRIRDLCASADVLLENFRPGVMRRLGLGYDVLSALNPKLVFCSISGYGQTGPYAPRGAFDVTIQAMSGLMSVTGEDDGGPVKCGVPVGDFCAGLYAAYTIVAALFERQQRGRGRYIDCSMLGSLLGISALQTSEFFGTGQSAKRLGSAHPRNAPYQAFRGSDDYFAIAAGNDKLWRAVCEIVGMPELVSNPKFETQLLRARNQVELADILQAVFRTRPAAHWLEQMQQHGVPASSINSFEQVLGDEHVNALGWVQDLELPNGVRTKTTAYPVGISEFEFTIRRQPPRLGEHTDEVLAEWCGNG